MTIVWLTFMVISQMSQASICAMAKKVEDKTEDGEGDILLMGTINIPSQWDDGVFLFAEA